MQTPGSVLTVVLIDDHDIVTFGLETLLRGIPGLQVVGSANSLAKGLALIAERKPLVAITDMSLGDSKGIDTVQAVVLAQQERAVLVLSMHDEMLYAAQALNIGARGYIMKDQAHSQVAPALQAIAAGTVWVSPQVNSQLLNRLSSRSGRLNRSLQTAPTESLTLRELQVLQGVKKGMTTKEIAFYLELSVRTVDIYRANIKRKLGVRNSAELLTYALSRL